MGTWTKEVVLDDIEFDGDKVVFTVTRLLAADMASIMTHYVPERKMLVFAGGNAEMAALAADVFPKYITGISGMSKGDGTLMTVPDFMGVSREFFFVPLVTQLFAGLMQASSVGAATKNSISQPPNKPEALSEETSST